MANKMFYVKDLDSGVEMCMTIGWEHTTKYSIFYRSKISKETLRYVGLFESKEAWDIFNAAKNYTNENVE